jgi:hypothetical protein
MPSSMDKSPGAPAGSPGYETRDAHIGGVLKFMLYLALGLAASCLFCWWLFRYFSVIEKNPTSPSPFAETRQLPAGPQLQVNPRQDLLKFRAEQQQALNSYAWEDRDAGTVRIPIDRAMDLLLKKGIPVAPGQSQGVAPAEMEKPASEGSAQQ